MFARIGAPGAPNALARGAEGTIYVTTNNGTARGTPLVPSRVFSYRRDGSRAAGVAVEGQPPDHADGVTAAAVDPGNGHLVVVDANTARVIEVEPDTGRQRVLAKIPDLPPCFVPVGASDCQPGALDAGPVPSGAAFDARGTLYVSDSGQATIWRLVRGERKLQVWYQSFDFSTGDAPAGVAFDGRGHLLVTAGSSFDGNNPQSGGLYAIAIASDGSAGGRTLRATFSDADAPGAVAVGATRRAYVVLRGARAVVSVRPDGKAAGRYELGARLDAPGGVVVDADRFLVANQSTTNDPEKWHVIAVGIKDRPPA
jgi:hypothetical protein